MALQPNDSVGSTGTSYSDVGSDTGSSVKDRGREIVSDAKETARQLVSQGTDRARTGIEETKHRAARELSSVANALRGCGGELNGEENSMLAPYVERVADQVHRVANALETRTVDDLTQDVGEFARRNPALFLGGCFAVGVLAARFLKASKPDLPVLYNPNQSRYAMASQGTTEFGGYNEPNGGGAMYGGAMRGTTGSIGNTIGDRGITRDDIGTV